MGHEASLEPKRPRPPAYGRRGPCRWRSEGQRAETAGELTVGNEVPCSLPDHQPGLAKTWCVDKEPGGEESDRSPNFQRPVTEGQPRCQNLRTTLGVMGIMLLLESWVKDTFWFDFEGSS